MRKPFNHALLLLTVAMSIAAAPPKDLSATLAPLADKYKLPGVVGAIIHGDELVALGSTGIRKVGDLAPFLSTDLIHLGSDTKAMTAILIGQLIDQKKLAFDTSMREIFPDMADKMDPQMAKVTIRNLLTHDAGLPQNLKWGAIQRQHRTSLTEQRHRAVEIALSSPPRTPIGKYSYSNAGYVLLGAIVEFKTGKPWEDVIQQEIFKPLKMDSAGFGAPGTLGMVDQPWGHIIENDALKPLQSDNLPVMAPAGEVHCTITDWAKLIAEMLHGTQGHPTLVSAETFKALTDPVAGQNYAGGWLVTHRPWAGGLALTHSGSNTMWYCTVWIAPNKNFAVMVATNVGSDPAAEAVDDGIGRLIAFNSQLTAKP